MMSLTAEALELLASGRRIAWRRRSAIEAAMRQHGVEPTSALIRTEVLIGNLDVPGRFRLGILRHCADHPLAAKARIRHQGSSYWVVARRGSDRFVIDADGAIYGFDGAPTRLADDVAMWLDQLARGPVSD